MCHQTILQVKSCVFPQDRTAVILVLSKIRVQVLHNGPIFNAVTLASSDTENNRLIYRPFDKNVILLMSPFEPQDIQTEKDTIL